MQPIEEKYISYTLITGWWYILSQVKDSWLTTTKFKWKQVIEKDVLSQL